MVKRTTLVDRRILTLVVQGIPELSEEVIEYHLKHAALLHQVEGALLQADLTRVDLEALMYLLRPELSNEIRRFAPGVLVSVRALGSQFVQAQMTTVPGGETLESQRNKVVKFRTDWHFKPEEAARLTVSPSVASQVIYLPDLVEGSLSCSFDKVEEGRKSVEEIIASLPKVKGLRWIVGNAPTVNRILANHPKEDRKYYPLSVLYTWTTDEYESPEHGRCRLVVGNFDLHGVVVSSLPLRGWNFYVGLFVLGVPE